MYSKINTRNLTEINNFNEVLKNYFCNLNKSHRMQYFFKRK